MDAIDTVSNSVPDQDVDITIPPEEFVERTRAQKCANCCKKFLAFLFSTVGLSGMTIAYTFFGGFIFMSLEGPNEQELKNNVQVTWKQHVDHLYNITIEMNVFHRENWTVVAGQVMLSFGTEMFKAIKENGWDGKDGEGEMQWTFAGAILYSITVITTIGYGHLTPKTQWGRLVTIFYALIGIPLTLLTVSNLGSIMATAVRYLYKNIICGICCLCCQKPDRATNLRAAEKYDAENGDPGASKRLTSDSPDCSTVSTLIGVLCVSLLLITAYIICGALLFTLWEDWDVLIGSYICFISLTTIGFGDYVPGTVSDSRASQTVLILWSLYLIFGLVIIAMCFHLIREEVHNKCHTPGKKICLVSKTCKGKDENVRRGSTIKNQTQSGGNGDEK